MANIFLFFPLNISSRLFSTFFSPFFLKFFFSFHLLILNRKAKQIFVLFFIIIIRCLSWSFLVCCMWLHVVVTFLLLVLAQCSHGSAVYSSRTDFMWFLLLLVLYRFTVLYCHCRCDATSMLFWIPYTSGYFGQEKRVFYIFVLNTNLKKYIRNQWWNENQILFPPFSFILSIRSLPFLFILNFSLFLLFLCKRFFVFCFLFTFLVFWIYYTESWFFPFWCCIWFGFECFQRSNVPIRIS